jgi:hypothetical protein
MKLNIKILLMPWLTKVILTLKSVVIFKKFKSYRRFFDKTRAKLLNAETKTQRNLLPRLEIRRKCLISTGTYSTKVWQKRSNNAFM